MGGEDSFYIYCQEHFASWLRCIRSLSRENQDLLLSYYLTGASQNRLAMIFGSTQTVCSFRLRMAAKIAGTFLMMGGPPTVEAMRVVLVKSGVEDSLKGAPLSELIGMYARCRSFERVAATYRVHRPAVRKAMSRAAKHLLQSDFTFSEVPQSSRTPKELALGAYIFNLIDKADPSNVGTTKRQKEKTARCVVRVDPPCVGEFRVAVNDPGWASLFVARANR